VNCLQRTHADSVVSVVEVPHQFNPTSVMRLDEGRLRPFVEGDAVTRRQDKPRLFARNGPAVLAVHARVIEAGSLYGEQTLPLMMTPDESIDVDTPWDLQIAEWIVGARTNAHSV
jgi:CMP-N-acetylneuraminic acid synthetase